MWQDSFDALEEALTDIDAECNDYILKCRSDQLAILKKFIRDNIMPQDVLYSNCSRGYIIAYTFIGIDEDGVVHLIEDLGLQNKPEQTMSIEKFYKLMKENT